jgi:hypothetical protein
MSSRHRVNDGLLRFADNCRTLAKDNNAPVIDMNTGVLDVLKRQHQKDRTYSFYDKLRVHPDMRGHFVMAYVFLKAQNAPGIVSDVEIDAAGKKVVVQQNCRVSDLKASDASVGFTFNAGALPFPTDELHPLDLGLVPFMEELNREKLCIKGFKPGAYTLTIDDVEVGAYTAAQLAAGVNLAENKLTPQYRQAAELAKLNLKRGDLAAMLRGFALIDYKTLNRFAGDKEDIAQVKAFFDKRLKAMEGKHWQKFFTVRFAEYLEKKPQEAAMRSEIAAIEKKLYELNKPKTHRYRLTRSGDKLPLPGIDKIKEPAGLTFHLPFDKSLTAAKSEPDCKPAAQVQLDFETGPIGEAVIIKGKGVLRYPEPDSFPLNASSISFWVKPHWDIKETKWNFSFFRKDDPQRVDGKIINGQDFGIYVNAGKKITSLFYSSSRCGRSNARWNAESWQKGEWLHVCATVKKFGRQWGTRLYIQGKIAAIGQWQTPPQEHLKTFSFGSDKYTFSIDDFRGYNSRARYLSSKPE